MKIDMMTEKIKGAEGTESRVQIDRLRDLGCEIIQGYIFAAKGKQRMNGCSVRAERQDA